MKKDNQYTLLYENLDIIIKKIVNDFLEKLKNGKFKNNFQKIKTKNISKFIRSLKEEEINIIYYSFKYLVEFLAGIGEIGILTVIIMDEVENTIFLNWMEKEINLKIKWPKRINKNRKKKLSLLIKGLIFDLLIVTINRLNIVNSYTLNDVRDKIYSNKEIH